MKRSFIPFVALTLLLSGCLSEYPTDEALLRHFDRNEAAFNDLVTQVQARPDIDTLRRNVVFYENGRRVAPGTEPELRKMMKRLNLEAVTALDGETAIYLELVSRPWPLTFGFVNADKGYAYLVMPPHPNFVVNELDEEFGTQYKLIKANWYLFMTVRD